MKGSRTDLLPPGQREPEGEIESALRLAAESSIASPRRARGASPTPAPDSSDPPEPPRRVILGPDPVQRYELRDVAVVLAVFAAASLALGSEGLLGWANRMEVGHVQSAWLAVLGPVNRAFDAVRLTVPRRAAIAAADDVARALGAGEDPLFADAWRAPVREGLADEPEPPEPPAQATRASDAERSDAEVGRDGPATVLLIGDSMMAGNLATAITRSLADDARFRVLHASQTATGLARPDIFDWMDVAPALVARERPRFIVCSFGANDGQGMRGRDGLVAFGEPAWDVLYRKRVLAMMRALASDDTLVLWLGLPPMRDPRFAHRLRHLNRIYSRAAKQVPGVEYLELSMLVSGPEGGFSSYVRGSNGRLVRIRMDDGVHYSPAGARAIAPWIADWIRERLERPETRH